MKLLILGAGGHGQVCKEIAEMSNIYNQIDFIDDNLKLTNVIGTFNNFRKNIKEYKNEYNYAFLGIGNIKVRNELIKLCDDNKFNFCNLISTNAFISKSVKLGTGIFISHGAIVNANSTIEDNVILGIGARVDHNVIILNNTYVKADELIEANSTYPNIKKEFVPQFSKNVCTFDE